MSAKRLCLQMTAAFLTLLLASRAGAVDLEAGTGASQNADFNTGSLSRKEIIGTDVPILYWSDPRTIPWAALLCIHGLGLHAGSFSAFGQRMSHLGVPTYAIDVRGFGSWKQSEGLEQLDFKSALQDVKNALISIHKAQPDLPVFLLGESMGGAIALHASAANPQLVDGVISSVPAATRYKQKATSVKVAAAMLKGPNRPINIGKQIVKQATSQQDVANDWCDDPQARLLLSPKELIQFQSFMNKNVSMARKITDLPVLMLQGGSDRLVKPKGTMAVFDALGTRHKDLLMIGTKEHLIFEGGQFDQQVIDSVASWMDKHLKNQASAGGKAVLDSSPEAVDQAQGHLLLAQGYLKLKDAKAARDNLMTVIKLARGTPLAQQAQDLLLSLPTDLIAPLTGVDTKSIAKDAQFVFYDEALRNPKPSVLCFCASWLADCKPQQQATQKALSLFGDKVNFVTIDADDPKNDRIVKRYGIGPLPALLFLSPNNEVVSYLLGYSDETAIAKGIAKILATDRK